MIKNRIPLTIFLFIILIDQFSKFLVLKKIAQDDMITIFNGILLTNIQNRSLAYTNVIFEVVITTVLPLLILLLLVISLLKSDNYTKLQRWALWCIAGGCISNIIDIITKKNGIISIIHITQINFIPNFNIADLIVGIGVIIMLLSIIIRDRRIIL